MPFFFMALFVVIVGYIALWFGYHMLKSFLDSPVSKEYLEKQRKKHVENKNISKDAEVIHIKDRIKKDQRRHNQ